MTTAAHLGIDPRHVDNSWLAIVRRHHEAKALARCGKKEQANALIRDALPPLIREWGRLSGLPRPLQMLRLRKLLGGDLSPKSRKTPVRASIPNIREKRHRIPLSDIPAMIDTLHLQEAREREFLPLAS